MDRRGQSRNARRREGRRARRGRREPSQPGRAVVPARPAARPRAQSRTRRGRTGPRDRASPFRPLVARSDFRRARLDHRQLARRTSRSRWASVPRTSRATGWSSRRGPRFGTSGKAGRSSRSTRKPSDSCSSRRSSGWRRPGSRCMRSPTSPGPATSPGTTWSTGPTMPISASASGPRAIFDGVRSVNTRDLNAYLRRIEAGLPATGPSEELSPEARARETAILMLRRTQTGIERDDFLRQDRLRARCPRRRNDRAVHGARVPRGRRTASPPEPRGPLRRRPGPVRVSLSSRDAPTRRSDRGES